MFEQLSSLFGAHIDRLRNNAEKTKDGLVEAIAKSQGLSLSPKPAPTPDYGGLTPTQFRAFECAYEALLERMARGASGLAPDFAALERLAISQLSAGGWAPAASPTSEASLAARAAVSMLAGNGRRMFANALAADDIGAIKQAYERALDRLAAAESASGDFVIRQHLFAHPECADAFVHLYWRDEKGRTFTYFDIVLGFGAPFAKATTNAALSDVVFQTFRQSFQCDVSPVRLVTGGFFLGGRDGIGTNITGFVLPDPTSQRLAGDGLNLPPCLLCLSLYERLL